MRREQHRKKAQRAFKEAYIPIVDRTTVDDPVALLAHRTDLVLATIEDLEATDEERMVSCFLAIHLYSGLMMAAAQRLKGLSELKKFVLRYNLGSLVLGMSPPCSTAGSHQKESTILQEFANSLKATRKVNFTDTHATVQGGVGVHMAEKLRNMMIAGDLIDNANQNVGPAFDSFASSLR
ncbi:hypothetical protein cyc_06479 [Cyclospora cayetanensis]|uniref:Uncharacterized protein n=1 Tax=Cyclospora cayetanensis TaxID=88456 RepID=A0A1D3D3I3_9EIME|nr:hypothetical protein cyc_06479 [Cyclospora cayetanensis]